MSRLPDLDSLRLLVLVQRWGSLTAAAAELRISQPSASKRLRSLERLLGLQLLTRTPRGSELTPAGSVVCAQAVRVLDELTLLQASADAFRRERGTELTIAASLTVAEHLLPGWLGRLRSNQPDLHVGLQVHNSVLVRELVGQNAVDLGFIESPGEPDGLHTAVVGHDRLVLVVAPAHPWAHRRAAVGPAELAGTPLISREAGSGTRETIDRAIADGHRRPPRPLMELGSGAAVRSAVLAGAGAALLSELVVSADLADGRLVEVATTGLDLRRTLRAVWRAGTRPSAPAAALLASIGSAVG